jgi:two-component system NtrC family sensor kinase
MNSPDAELRQMAALGRLAVGLAHEINSPIGSVLSNNVVILRCLDDLKGLLSGTQPGAIDRATRVVETCRRLAEIDRIACERIRGLIGGMKGFARVDDGQPGPVDLNREIRDTVCLATCQFGDRIQTELDLGDLPEFVGYRQMLNQVVLNLLVNAAQAIELSGKIAVRTRREDGAIHISVSDTGNGMTAAQKEHVFQAGFTTRPRGEGTGLGLSISREIVEEKHGGSIGFESKAGVGTTFHIRLPLTGSVAA